MCGGRNGSPILVLLRWLWLSGSPILGAPAPALAHWFSHFGAPAPALAHWFSHFGAPALALAWPIGSPILVVLKGRKRRPLLSCPPGFFGCFAHAKTLKSC